MGAKTGCDNTDLNNGQQFVIKEGLLKRLANRDGVIYELPPDEELSLEATRGHRVETGD